ncbi:hemagglutinin repeat-containing protein [Bartonella tamiae]|nr:hemagglutinin repeat-containing protein [Bartonella tamiae]
MTKTIIKYSFLNSKTFKRLPQQLLAGVLSFSLIMQPLFVSAQQISVDPNAGASQRPNIGAAPNGVPMIDIATPNGAGLSHNKYNNFNIGAPGVILNNHNGEVGISQLGGVTPGNPNLRTSGSASVILNEVTSGNRSALEGPAEIFGRQADVIIANPNGITCNGCGFINTPRATLTTGIPQIGLDGRLTGFDVQGGDVTFGEKGANLSSGKGSVDIFDVVSRTVILDGPVSGHDIGIHAGTGKFDYASREFKELTDIAGKPQYAIDGSALGALQADRIKIVATEKGVGVRMRNDMAANAGEISLSANGKIALNKVSGRDGVTIKANDNSIEARTVTSKKTVNIQADQGVTLETIGADGDIMVNAGHGLISAEGDLIAGGNLSLTADGSIKANQVASGNQMLINAGQDIDVLVAVANGQASLQNRNGNIRSTNGIKAGTDLNVTANKGLIEAATLISFNNMTLSAGQDLNITGNVKASNTVDIETGRNLNAGFILAGSNINLHAFGNIIASTIANGLDMNATDETGNLTFARQANIALKAAQGSITAGNIYSTNTIDASSNQALTINNTLAASGNVAVEAASVSGQRLIAGMQLIGQNNNGALNGTATTNIVAKTGDIVLQQILSGSTIQLNANQGSITSNQIQSGADVNTSAQNGSITAQQIYTEGTLNLISGHTVTISGASYSGRDFNVQTQQANLGDATIGGNLIVNSNALKANRLSIYGNANLNAQDINLQTLFAGRDIIAHTNNFVAQRLISGLDIDKANETGLVSFNTSGGKTVIDASNAITLEQAFSGNDLQLNAKNNIQYQYLFSNQNASLTTEQGNLSLENNLVAGGDISLSATSLDLSNNRAKIQTAKTLALKAQTVDVSNSTLTYGGLTINAASAFNVQNAKLSAIKSGGGSGDIQLNIPTLVVDRNTNILADNDFKIITSSLENNGQLASANDLQINTTGTITNNSTGLIYTAGNGALFADGDIVNDFGAIIAQGNLKFANNSGNGKNSLLKNKAGLIQSGKNLSILTNHLINEADVNPELSQQSSTNTGMISFDTPKDYDQLGKYGQIISLNKVNDYEINPYPLPALDPRYVYALGYDNTTNTWGILQTSNNDTPRLAEQLYQNKEEAYSTLVIDGITYKTDNWLLGYTRLEKRLEFYYLNPLPTGMQKTETGQVFNVETIKSGLIQAGNDLTIDADVIDNNYSNIEAGNNATITAQTVNNVGATAYTTSSITCVSKSQCMAYDADGNRIAGKDLAAGSTITTGMVATKSFAATIKAGGALQLNATTLNNTVAENTIAGSAKFEAEATSGNPLDALNGLTAGGALFDKNIDLNLVQKENGNFSLATAIERGDISAPKPNSGGFGGTLPNQYFVYETRAAFLDVGKFYGSGYFMNRIGYNPDHQILFLGDAYFENQLIDKQMRDLVGEGLGNGSFVPGNDPIEQMKSLLDAGIEYSNKNGLTFGEPLTAEQVASLDKFIVVYVKQNVNGMEVYAPVLYISAKDKASISASGSKIEGGSVNITTNTVNNSGLISSNSDLKIQGVDILSNGGAFASRGDMILASTNNLELNAGTTSLNGQTVILPTQAINAGGTAILSADNNLSLNGVNAKAGESMGLSGKNVTIGTATATTANGSQNVTGSSIETGKDLQVKADNDITVTGSSLNAGDRMALSAESGNLTIQSAEANRVESSSFNTTQQKSELNSGGSMSLSADKNVVIAGSDAHADGNLAIDAGQSVAIVATQDKSVEVAGKRVSLDSTQQSSNVSSDKNMGVKAGEDILIGASNLDAKGNMSLDAQGEITITSMENKSEDHIDQNKYKMNRDETTQVGSSLTAGGNVTAIAGQDGKEHNLNIIGSSIDADGKVGLKATGDVSILAAEDSYHEDISTKSKTGGLFKKTNKKETSTDTTTTVGSSISGNDGVNIQAGNNVTVSASDIVAGTDDKTADLNVKAGGDLLIASGKDTQSTNSNKSTKKLLGSSSKKQTTYDETNVASNLGATGNVNLSANGNAVISGSNVVAGEDVNIIVSSVSVIGAQEDHASTTDKKKTGFGVGSGDGFYSIYGSDKRKKTTEETKNIGSNVVAGGDVNIVATQTDVNIIGSNVTAGNDINLDAARDVNILPGNESYEETESKKKSGFGLQIQGSSTGGSIGIGYGSSTDKKSSDQKTNTSSTLTAGNDVNISAGRDANLQAADVSSGRDINIYAENNVNLLAANDVSNYKEMHEKLFAGVTVSVGSNIANAAQSIANSVDRIGGGDWKSDIGNSLVALSQANDIKKMINSKDLGLSAGIGVGFNHSKYESLSKTSTPVVTTLEAGRAIDIEAGNNITSQGAQINAGTNPIWNFVNDNKAGDISLSAGNEINLISAQGLQKNESNSNSSGAQFGISTTGPMANGYYSNGNSSSNEITNLNTHIAGTGDITLKSGADTNLNGAVITGDSLKAEIGGNLNIVSPQDTEVSKNKNQTISGGFNGNVSASWQQSNSSGNYASVIEQSGIKVGDGGFNIKVNNNTGLIGGIISSTATADKNRLETGTLTTNDIKNFAEANADSKGFNLPSDIFSKGKYGIGKTVIGNLLNSGHADDSSKGHTNAAISNGTIIIKDEAGQMALTGHNSANTIASLNRDTENAHQAADKINIHHLEQQAANEQALKQDLINLGFKYSDEAYKTTFIKEHPVSIIEYDENGIPQARHLTDEEKQHMQPGSDGKINISANGIFNNEQAAIHYALQHAGDKSGPLYIVWFPKADNSVSELMIAGYQKNLENNFWGLTNSAQEVVDLMKQYGQNGLDIYGHSRGTMTVGNALSSLKNSGVNNALGNTNIHFFGPAYNAQQAANSLYDLSGGQQNGVYLQNNKYDYVGSVIGGNPASNNKIPSTSNKFQEWFNMTFGKKGYSTHSCYGNASDDCKDNYGKSDTIIIKAKGAK